MSLAAAYIVFGYITVLGCQSLLEASPVPNNPEGEGQTATDDYTSTPESNSRNIKNPGCTTMMCITFTTGCKCRCVEEWRKLEHVYDKNSGKTTPDETNEYQNTEESIPKETGEPFSEHTEDPILKRII